MTDTVREVIETYVHDQCCGDGKGSVTIRTTVNHRGHYLPQPAPRCADVLGAELYRIDIHVEVVPA